jgi:hypothetical protein
MCPAISLTCSIALEEADIEPLSIVFVTAVVVAVAAAGSTGVLVVVVVMVAAAAGSTGVVVVVVVMVVAAGSTGVVVSSALAALMETMIVNKTDADKITRNDFFLKVPFNIDANPEETEAV